MKYFIVTVVVALLFFLALMFGARNDQMVTISYFVAQGEYRLPVVLATVFMSGFIISWLMALYHITRMRLALRRKTRQLEKLESLLPVSSAKETEA
ncbi:MAG: lipopolysaccharide assembly protein LapA domain-containing protein [Shewanella sp.]|nr:lipopolysaccharide assembly protein LapA domain-containing protein [Shewanella sp.]MCF1439113.1 lipopolysaccharide assembly protein LapA domain-containing protein [Shewanella sp.]MCF1459223.1 lipopolysaccharide assembly protein LapA domain-containing protein [Shewanella sp.]